MSEIWSEFPGNLIGGQPVTEEDGVLKRQTTAMEPWKPECGRFPARGEGFELNNL